MAICSRQGTWVVAEVREKDPKSHILLFFMVFYWLFGVFPACDGMQETKENQNKM